jgi:hypothetical protein
MTATVPRPRLTGLLLVTAAACFWISWVLMPGVGVTDVAMILALGLTHLFALAIPGLAHLVYTEPNAWGCVRTLCSR